MSLFQEEEIIFFLYSTEEKFWLKGNECLDPRVKEQFIEDDFGKVSNGAKIFVS